LGRRITTNVKKKELTTEEHGGNTEKRKGVFLCVRSSNSSLFVVVY
jgi:hypothetical protein